MSLSPVNTPSCGIPFNRPTEIQLGHGGGGKMMQKLISEFYSEILGPVGLKAEHDSAILSSVSLKNSRLAMTTDSYVIKPLFFPGGDIGKLSVYGTCNDLAMSGARPIALTLGLILEEGFALSTLRTILESIRDAALECKVQVVTGDTKVVETGKGDGIYINTSGLGIIENSTGEAFRFIHPSSVDQGDAILVSGDLGRHGMAIMAAREGLEFENPLQSDLAPLFPVVETLLKQKLRIRCIRDLTRGGLASALHEIASFSRFSMEIEEGALPVTPEVRGACEILGMEPISIANEGRMVVFVPRQEAQKTLELLREAQRSAALIGWVGEKTKSPMAQISIRNPMGISRLLDLPNGEQLPRIC